MDHNKKNCECDIKTSEKNILIASCLGIFAAVGAVVCIWLDT